MNDALWSSYSPVLVSPYNVGPFGKNFAVFLGAAGIKPTLNTSMIVGKKPAYPLPLGPPGVLRQAPHN